MEDFSKGMRCPVSHARNTKSACGQWFEERRVLGEDPNSRMHSGDHQWLPVAAEGVKEGTGMD